MFCFEVVFNCCLFHSTVFGNGIIWWGLYILLGFSQPCVSALGSGKKVKVTGLFLHVKRATWMPHKWHPLGGSTSQIITILTSFGAFWRYKTVIKRKRKISADLECWCNVSSDSQRGGKFLFLQLFYMLHLIKVTFIIKYYLVGSIKMFKGQSLQRHMVIWDWAPLKLWCRIFFSSSSSWFSELDQCFSFSLVPHFSLFSSHMAQL